MANHARNTGRTRGTDLPVTSCGYTPLMTGKLTQNGYVTWGDILNGDYREMLKIKGFGLDMMTTIIEDLEEFGGRLKNMPQLSENETERMTQIRKDKDDAMGRSRSHSGGRRTSPLKTGVGMGAAGLGHTPSRRANRSPVDDLPYVSIIIQRGFKCRSCEQTTIVENPAELPKGIEFSGFRWSDSVGGGSVEPYFLCITCAQDIEIMGKLAIDLMTGER